jgi:hypothetical protein
MEWQYTLIKLKVSSKPFKVVIHDFMSVRTKCSEKASANSRLPSLVGSEPVVRDMSLFHVLMSEKKA